MLSIYRQPSLRPCLALATLAMFLAGGSGLATPQPVSHSRKQTTGKGIQTQQQKIVGLVIDISGAWAAEKNDQTVGLKYGDVIREGWKLKRLSEQGTVSIALLDGSHIKCPGHEMCGCAFVAQKNSTRASQWWSSTIEGFGTKKKRLIMPVSRSSGERPEKATLRDLVLRLADKIDVAPVFEGFTDGDYRLRLERVGNDRVDSSRLIAVKYAHGSPVLVQAKDLPDGLYRLRLLDEEDEPSQSALMLLIAPERYDKISAAFNEASKMAGELSPDLDNAKRRQFLQNYIVVFLDGPNS